MASLLTPTSRAKIGAASAVDLRQLIRALTEDTKASRRFRDGKDEVIEFAQGILEKKGTAPMAVNQQKRGIGLANIREVDTAGAARSVVPSRPATASPGGPGPFGAVALRPSGTGTQQTKAKPGTAPQKEDESDPFGAVLGFLRDSLGALVGVPTRSDFARRAQARQRKQNIEAYDMIIKGTQNVVSMLGDLPEGKERAEAAEIQFAAMNLIQPGAGDAVREGWEAHIGGRLKLESLEKPWIVEQIAANCGTGPGAQDCVNEFTRDEGWVQRQDDMHDAALLPDIMDWFNKIGQAAASVDGGEDAIVKLAENGWTADELRRLPPEFQFPEEQLEAITRSEMVQEQLIPFGFKPTGLVRKEAEVEIAEAAKPTKALSPAGKEIQDRELFKKTFGEDSPQVKAFDEAASEEGGAVAPKLSDERGMRQEFTKLSAPFVAVQNSFRKVKATAGLGTAAGDLSLIFAYMKMLDPESVVREGEQATAENARGVTDSVRNIYNKLTTGVKLTAKQRKEFVASAEKLFELQTDSQNNLVKQFEVIAKISGIDSAKVVVDFFLKEQKATDPVDALLDQLEAQTGGP